MSETSQSALMVFLFTDIAGAVNLKARLGDAEAARIILRHDELFRRAISLSESGKIAQDTGDGFLAEFTTASDAVQTALRFQRDIHTEPWKDEPIRVRTGVHLGEVTDSADKSIGLAKDFAARLMGMAMPGQILTSRSAFDAARQHVREHPRTDSADPLPDLRWMDHGPYLFKGAEDSMNVFEVGAVGIAPLKAPPSSEKAKRADFPKVPPSSEPAVPGQSRRNVVIDHDAAGNLMITGDSNIVIINTVPQVHDETEEEAAKHPLGPNPYRGLLAFQEEHARFMFGRSRLIERLWKRFRDLHNQAPSDEPMRLLPIIGPSGCGKSSLVRAGLLPELAAQPFLGIEFARVAVLTPGAHPVETLARALARVATNEKVPLGVAREFERELNHVENGQYCGLRRIAGYLPNVLNILFVDQFEDVYTLCKERSRRQVFVKNLLHACSDPDARLSVILCLRSDFLAETPENLTFNNVIAENGVFVPEMIEDQTRRAIREPARLAGHPLDDAVVELLLAQTAESPGALGLLQFALKSIWEGLQTEVTPMATLQRIGGVGGSLAREAQRIYASLSSDDQVIAQRCFVELAQVGDPQLAEGTRVTRHWVKLNSLVAYCDDPADVHRVLNRFATPAARLIALSADAEGSVMAQVTHEAIFSHWRLLRQWLESNRGDRHFRHRLNQAAQHWRAQERPEGSLWRPPDLDLLRDYHDRARHDMNALQLEFFTASEESAVRRLEKERRAEEDLKQERQLNRTMLERSPTGMLIYDESGQCVFANAAAAELVGVPQDALLQQNYHDFKSWRKMGVDVLADEAFRTGEIPSAPIDFPIADVRVPCEGQFMLIRSREGPRLLLMMSDNTALRLTQLLSATPRLKGILSVIVNALRDTLDADRATIFQYDAVKDELFTTVAHGLNLPAEESGEEDSSARKSIRLSATDGLAGESFQTRAIINVPEAYEDERFNRRIDKDTGYRTKTILTIPLITHQGEIVGVAQVLNKDARAFDAEDERIAAVLAAEAAAAIKRGQLIEDQQVQIDTGVQSQLTAPPVSIRRDAAGDVLITGDANIAMVPGSRPPTATTVSLSFDPHVPHERQLEAIEVAAEALRVASARATS